MLIPNPSSLAAPLQYRRDQDVFISSRIELNCNSSLSMITQWTISNCTSICSSPIVADSTIITTFAELFIPSRTLSYGTYQLKLTVTVGCATELSSSTSAYVTITPPGITVNMVLYGASMITRGEDQNLTLDPGSYSIDRGGDAFNASVSIAMPSRQPSS